MRDCLTFSWKVCQHYFKSSKKVIWMVIWDSSIFHLIQPKLDMWLLVDFCIFPQIYLSWTQNCSVLMIKTILSSAQVNFGENRNQQSHAKFWLNWKKYGAVSYLLSFIKENWKQNTYFSILHNSIATKGRVNPMQAERHTLIWQDLPNVTVYILGQQDLTTF